MPGRHTPRRCVRDELFVLGHDEDSGYRPRIHTATLSVGLAGAVLVDLLLSGEIHIEAGHVSIRNPAYRRLADDPIADRVVADLTMTGAWLPLREVIAGTAASLYERTLIHLITTNVVTARTRRFRSVRYQPTDPSDVVHARHYPRARVKNVGTALTVPDPATDAVCGLIRALGIEDTLYLELPADDIRVRLDTITAAITTASPDPHVSGIPGLITTVEAAVGDLAVAVYR